MASKKKAQQLIRHCRITQFIEAQDPALAEAVHDLCMDHVLAPGRGGEGVTFLFPKEKAYRAEIVAKAYSEEANEAVKMIEALVIPFAIHGGPEFRARKLGTRRGIALKVEAVEGDHVTLEGGVELEPEGEFVPLGGRGDVLAVWRVTKGRLPTEGPEFVPERRQKKVGGAITQWRAAFAERVKAEFDECWHRDRLASHDPYLAKSLGLLQFLKLRRPEVFRAVAPLIDYSPFVTFYIMLEPYQSRGEHLIPDEVLYGPDGWNGAEAYMSAVDEYTALIPAPASDAAALIAAIDRVRKGILGSGASNLNKFRTPEAIVAAYRDLVTTNRIGGVGPVFPAETLARLSPSKKLWQDTFRLVHGFAMVDAFIDDNVPAAVDDVIASVCLHAPGDDYERETIVSVPALRAEPSPSWLFYLIVKFLNSSDFLYCARPPAEVPKDIGGEFNEPADLRPCNRDRIALAALDRQRAGMRRAAGLSAKALAELRIAISLGALPAEVRSAIAAPAATPAPPS